MSKRIIGITAEYNPFHQGHAWQIDYVKKNLDAEYVVIVMSGSFTQRGIPAVIDKYERAKLALFAGADLVIEMPVVGATSSAETFARCGVATLNAIGADAIAFGAEDANKEKFSTVASALSDESFIFKRKLNEHLKAGDNFAKARALALEESTGDNTFTEFLSMPNNILGIEYVKSLHYIKSKMDFIPISRNYDFKNSTSIRSELRLNGPAAAKDKVPDYCYELINRLYDEKRLIFINNFSTLLHRELIKNNDFNKFLDANDDLSNRTIKLRDNYLDIKDFARRVLKTKNITLTHIMRYLCHIMLDITYTDLGILKDLGFAPYGHILGIKEDSNILSVINNKSRIPVFTSYKDALDNLGEKEKILYEKDLFASDMYRIALTKKSKLTTINERNMRLVTV